MPDIEIHLYGKLRRFTTNPDPRGDSVIHVEEDGKTIAEVAEQLGISKEDLGANVFVNGEYSELSRTLHSGDRVGLFPDDMQLLYKWYFAPKT